MTKNIRISLYILIPILLWMISGLFVKDTNNNEAPKKDLFTVGTILTEAVSYQPTIKLKATSLTLSFVFCFRTFHALLPNL